MTFFGEMFWQSSKAELNHYSEFTRTDEKSIVMSPLLKCLLRPSHPYLVEARHHLLTIRDTNLLRMTGTSEFP